MTNASITQRSRDASREGSYYAGLERKVVLNTGGASGIGKAMAHGFARHGAQLMLLDLNEAALLEAKQELISRFPDLEVGTLVASVTDEEGIERACDLTLKRFGRIDILLNNAGIAMNKPALDLTATDWRRAIDIDLSGVFYCAQAVGRRMVRQGSGVILSTASMWGLSAAADRTAYCTAKAGVIAMSRCLAVEWAKHGIRVNAICPGYTRTALMEDLLRAGKINGAALVKRTPLGRLADPDEIAELALYLASDAASFITGQAIVSDGGWTADGFGS